MSSNTEMGYATFLEACISLSLVGLASAMKVPPLNLGCFNITSDNLTSKHCFIAYNSSSTQPDAKSACSSLGGRLAWITNEQTQDWLESSLREKLNATEFKPFWIALEMQSKLNWTFVNSDAAYEGRPLNNQAVNIYYEK